jgi:hypothetical protein
MIEKLNKVFEKLPPEHRDIMREAFIILIEEVINAIVKEIRGGFKKQGEENERMWQNIERIWQAIDRLTKSIEETRKTMKEGFERQEKENERIWQNIERIWQAMNERFERQEKENERIWQAIKEGFERQEKENQRIWQAIEEMRKDMREGFEKQAQENEKIWQAIKEGFERQEKENQRIWQAIEELRKDMKEGFERQEKETQRIWQAIEEDRKANQKHFKRLDRKLTAIGARWGLMAEGTFRAGLKTIIEDLGYAVENVVFFDDEGYVFLKPSRIEIDIIIKDGRKTAVEIKSSVSEGDVITFERKVKLYEKKFNIKIDKKIILTPFASSKAIEIAKSLDIEILEELKE